MRTYFQWENFLFHRNSPEGRVPSPHPRMGAYSSGSVKGFGRPKSTLQTVRNTWRCGYFSRERGDSFYRVPKGSVMQEKRPGQGTAKGLAERGSGRYLSFFDCPSTPALCLPTPPHPTPRVLTVGPRLPRDPLGPGVPGGPGSPGTPISPSCPW